MQNRTDSPRRAARVAALAVVALLAASGPARCAGPAASSPYYAGCVRASHKYRDLIPPFRIRACVRCNRRGGIYTLMIPPTRWMCVRRGGGGEMA